MAGTAAVVIVANGGSNINSVRWALKRLGVDSQLSDRPEQIATAPRVILPGVGAAPAGMSALQQRELTDCVTSLQQPVLGVCLGMQLLFEHSEEGDTPGLGVIPGRVEKLAESPQLRVPHMGWNRVQVLADDPLLAGLSSAWFYFVHGYAVNPASAGDHALALSQHGREFVAVARKENFYGVQFHPEKSAAAGARLLKNFLEL